MCPMRPCSNCIRYLQLLFSMPAIQKPVLQILSYYKQAARPTHMAEALYGSRWLWWHVAPLACVRLPDQAPQSGAPSPRPIMHAWHCTGLVYRAMGFPPQFFTVLFAVPRVTGYLAHWREQLADPDLKIARPQQNYTVRWFGCIFRI